MKTRHKRQLFYNAGYSTLKMVSKFYYEVKKRSSARGRKQLKRQRTAALQDLAEEVARNPSRQRLGVRLSSAALTPVRCQAERVKNSRHSASLHRRLRILEPAVLALVCFLSLAQFATISVGQQTSAPPTRAEILKGALTPERMCYDVTSYNLDVRIDPATKSLKGSNKITFKTVNDFTRMQVDLWSNLPISKIIFDDGKDARFTRELNAVFVELSEQARKESVHSVTVFYSGVPVVAKRAPWDGGFTWDYDDEGNPWVVVTCPETGASIW